MFLKMSFAREAAFNMGESLKNGASVVTQLALVHFLFVHVLRRLHCVREDKCGYKITK